MYIESSSRTENDTARLISPVYDKTSEDVCFQFYYHMFGATIGTLRVYLKTVNQSWDLQPNLAFFVKKGNQGDKWYRSYNYLGSIKNDFQIIIEGVRGSGYVSDIAIDDVKIIIGCVDEEDSTTTMDTSTYNEVIPTVDSCENRCDQRENETSNQYHLRCDCDQDCVDNNRCCPDFYDFCTGVSNDGETMTTDSIAYSTESSVKTISTTTTVGYKTTTQVAKPKLTTVAFTTKISKIVRPVVYIKTQPVTPAIFRKTITTTKLTPRTTKKLFPTTSKPHIVSKAVIPSTSSNQTITLNIIDTAETEVNDVIAIPNPMNNDEALYDGISASKENWSDEFENSLDTPYTRNFSESNKLFSQIQEKDSKSSFLAISIGICVGIISISVLVFVIVRRYRFSKRKLHSSNGESQSDVRYLTSDDILDLSIANNYEDLLVH